MSYETLNETEWEQVDAVWDLLEKGETEDARRAVDALVARRGAHPDLKIVEAAVLLDEGEARPALHALKGAETSADPAFYFHLMAVAHFELVDLEAARDLAQKALAVQPTRAETHDLLSRVLEHLGDTKGADDHDEEAQVLDPERFTPPIEISVEEFDKLVEESLKELPEEVRRHLQDLPVMVEPLPRLEILTASDPPLSPDLLGLFVGRHLLERRHDDVPGVPGAIYLFRRNLLRVCHDREHLAAEIRITVQHEVGHLLGLDEEDLDRWGLA